MIKNKSNRLKALSNKGNTALSECSTRNSTKIGLKDITNYSNLSKKRPRQESIDYKNLVENKKNFKIHMDKNIKKDKQRKKDEEFDKSFLSIYKNEIENDSTNLYYNKAPLEYIRQIEDTIRLKEKANRIFTPTQKFNLESRSLIVNKISNDCKQLNLSIETSCLAVLILDSFLKSNLNKLHKSDVELLNYACLLIASKYEEVIPLEMEKDKDAFKKKQSILKLEKQILEALDYDIVYVTPLQMYGIHSIRILNIYQSKDMIETFSMIYYAKAELFTDTLPSTISTCVFYIQWLYQLDTGKFSKKNLTIKVSNDTINLYDYLFMVNILFLITKIKKPTSIDDNIKTIISSKSIPILNRIKETVRKLMIAVYQISLDNDKGVSNDYISNMVIHNTMKFKKLPLNVLLDNEKTTDNHILLESEFEEKYSSVTNMLISIKDLI